MAMSLHGSPPRRLRDDTFDTFLNNNHKTSPNLRGGRKGGWKDCVPHAIA
jgi:hypothetical protein